MSESVKHLQLVNQIIATVNEIVGQDNTCFIMSDAADHYPTPPQTEEGYRPDVFYQYDKLLIIGEAKTSDDIERQHSKLQYASYMKKCSLFHGRAILIVAVPWMDHAAAHNTLNRIKKDYSGQFDVRILDGIVGAL